MTIYTSYAHSFLIIIITMDDTINISLSLNKEELSCCACREPLTKQVYQCVNGNHYMCGTCEPKWTKNECPTCRHPSRLVRNIFFEEQLKQHLTPCPNIGCCEKFFKWNTDHSCLFAPVKCRVCKREVAGNITQYCSHLEGFCDDTFRVITAPPFKKKLQFEPNSCSSVLTLPDNLLLIMKKAGHGYKISAVKNMDNDLPDYKNIICTYKRNGIEYTVTIPITNLNELKVAEIHFSEGENAKCIFSKDVQVKPTPTPTPTPTQYNLDQSRLFEQYFGQAGFPPSTYLGSSSNTTYGTSTRDHVPQMEALLRALGNRPLGYR